MAEPWVEVAFYRYVLDPDQGWDQAKWDEGLWDGGLTSATQWTSVSCDVRGIDIVRGKQQVDLVTGVETGILRFDLDNRDGQWSQFVDLGNGVFAPALSAGVIVGVWSTTDDVNLTWHFLGPIESWVQEWTSADDVVHVTASDQWRYFVQQAAVAWTPGPLGEAVHTRFSRLLNRAGWDNARGSFIQQGNVSVLGSLTTQAGVETGLVVNGSSVADEMLRTALSDGGKCFLDGDGSFVYLNRHWTDSGPIPAIDVPGVGTRPGQGSVPLFGDWCDVPGVDELPYTELEWSYDGASPAGAVVVANALPPSVRDLDGSQVPLAWSQCGATRIGSLGRNVLALGDLRFVTQAEADALATYYLSTYEDAFIAARRLQIYPPLDDRLWTTALGLRIGDHVRVIRRERLNTLDLELVIEGVHLSITPEPDRTSGGHHFGSWLLDFNTTAAVVMLSPLGTRRRVPDRPRAVIEEGSNALSY